MLQEINRILTWLDGVVWGVPLMVLILAGGIYLTVRMGLLQVRKLPLALRWMVKNEETDTERSHPSVHYVPHFQQLSEQVIS